MTLRAEVHGPLAFPDGGSGDTVQPIAGAQLTFKCITGTDGGAFVGSSDITAEQKIVTDANGNFSIWLPLTTETIPTGTLWEVKASYVGKEKTYTLKLRTVGSFHLGDGAIQAVVGEAPTSWTPVTSASDVPFNDSTSHLGASNVQQAIDALDMYSAGAAPQVDQTFTGNISGATAVPGPVTPLEAKTLLGLGTAAAANTTDFDAAGLATTAQTNAEGYADSLVTGLLVKASNLSDVASASTARTNLGLGSAAVANKVAAGTAGVLDATDTSTTNSRPPTSHAASHASAGSDPVAIAASQVTGLGTAATADASSFDTAGSATTAQGNAATDAAAKVLVETNRAVAAEGLSAKKSANLSDLQNPAAALAVIGGISVSDYNALAASVLAKSANLADVADVATARGNLGLGSAALSDIGQFDPSNSTIANADGGKSVRQPSGLNNWFSKLSTAKSSGVAKVQVFGDSIASISGTEKSWPGIVLKILEKHNKVQPAAVLGSRFPGSGYNTVTTTAVGTSSTLGAGSQSSIIASGQEFTQTFYGDGITIIYGQGAAAGTGTNGGTITVYDGPSSGTAVSTFSAASGTTSYSNLQDVSLSLGVHTVTIRVTGGTGTLIEQVVLHAGTLTQGVDVRTVARFGYATSDFLPVADANSSQANGNSTSHGMALVGSWQPDLVILSLGQNDGSISTWQTNITKLADAVHALSPSSSVLIVTPYETGTTVTDAQSWITAAHVVVSTRSSWCSTTALSTQVGMNTFSGPTGLWEFPAAAGSVHPSASGMVVLGLQVASVVTGDPVGVALLAPAVYATAGATWTGNVTGNLTGQSNGLHAGAVYRPQVVLSGSRSLAVSDRGSDLTYSGATNITLTIDYGILNFSLYGYETRVIQAGAGTITFAGAGGYVASGATVTSSVSPAVILTSSVPLGATVLCTAYTGQLGTAAAANKVAAGTAGVLDATDASTTNARTPTAHATSHATGGSDVVTLTEAQVTGLTSDLAGKASTTGGAKEAMATVATSGSTLTLNLANANYFDVTLTANCAISFSGATSGVVCSSTVKLRQDTTGSRLVTWQAGTKWAGGVAPVLTTTASGYDVVTFFTTNGGTTRDGFLAGKAFA